MFGLTKARGEVIILIQKLGTHTSDLVSTDFEDIILN